MSLKEKIKTEVSKTIEKGKDINHKIVGISKDEFKKVLNKSETSATELKEHSKAILSGVQEGFEHEKAKTENSLHHLKEESVEKGKTIANVAHSLVEMTKEHTHNDIEIAKDKTAAAKQKLIDEAEKVKGNMEDVKEASKKDVSKTLQKLHNVNTAAKEKMDAVGAGIKDYTKEKSVALKEHTITDLHKAADKSKEVVNHIETTTKEHTKKFVSSSLSKTGDWLNKLSNKIQNK